MIEMHELPFLTGDVPGVGGRIKSRREDFRVEEVPLYEPSGEGTHIYFRIEKSGLPTLHAVQNIARALSIGTYDIGYAGLKDASAVTTQTLSLEHVDPARIEALDLPGIRVVDVSRHGNKLKLGHLAGNRFAIRVREVDVARVDEVRAMLEVLARRGVPNYFGPQRFGLRGDSWKIGRAMLLGDYDEALSRMLGRPGPLDRGQVREARELFERGDFPAAAEAWPYPFRNERRLCRALAKAKGDGRRAFRAIDKTLRRFFRSAHQSYLFNQVVARRVDALDRLQAGDLAWRHPRGAVFKVEDPAAEQARCASFEISPTGPLFGYRMTMPTGEPGVCEQELLAEANLALEDWRDGPERKVKGGRRPLRFRPYDATAEAGQDDVGPFIELRFRLESGCYATTMLREICKWPEHGDPSGGLETDS